ncbi:DNA-directed RNA polymerase subunit beta [Firmicutes bacterium AM29-6AC]|uniref:DNA-directed RNA polymerase subunit beta n=1 Tax=Anaerotignum faecicola TaxID=2358141 RepID=A0A401LGG0_9FIRM|nr:DNA-directed RNA polymerase subunit beta [Anaerotignum faecicola]RHR15079.1 DNA-directed RNA polymerase subunit beta [Firmicutes bacterium AF19-2LB]RHT39025.1 DNA-directed RNA polymerase subunit beta [Firmicutes bacterium AM29-6AC]GCB30603.1 DNA-directed RNA polymerase subunit beta [Anaerotignum faecicola]
MEKNRIRALRSGDTTRISYSKINEVLEMPNLIEVQKNSYQWFLDEGLKEVFEDISPITDFSGNLILEFIDFSLDSEPKYSIEECRERDATYAASLRVKARLYNRELDELKEQEIFMGDFPLMTETGTFIINGAERVIVSQLVRSPGIYYASEFDKVGKKLLSSTVIPNRGAWLEYETDSNDVFYVRVDRTRKVPVSVLIRAMGVGSDAEIIELFGEEPKILATLEKDVAKSYEEGLIEIYKKLRPGEPPTVESSASLLNGMLFDPKRYDLAKVGRYKFNKKLALRNRIRDAVLAENVVDPMTGEVIAEEGAVLTLELCDRIQDSGAGYLYIMAEEKKVKILSNQTVKIDGYLEEFGLTAEEFGIKERVYYPMLAKLLEENATAEEMKAAIKENIHELLPKHITLEDIFASINYVIHLDYGYGNVDDIDHLGNRRIRSVGELLQNQFRIGLSRMERVVRERMTTQDLAVVTPQALINVRPVTAAIKEFFGSSQLSQFMDQNNPLSELTHKRRLSALGPGGLSRDRAGFEVRDVHHSHYGRMCPIETPEGPNIGLINTLATFARINEYGFIEAPYRKVDQSGEEPVVTDEFIYVTADEEEIYNVAQANEPLDEEGHFVHKKVSGRRKEEIIEVDRKQVQLMDVSPKQMVSVATALIPFLENDDANRALMGSNMQRQAVPLLVTDSPVVGTGMEYKTAKDSGICIIAKNPGVVERVSADEIVVRNDNSQRDVYKLIKYQRSNQSTCLNQKPIVDLGQRVEADQIIADGASTCKGELALGKNPLIGFMTWEGYNYEDAVLLSEKLVQEDVYTSVHISEFEADARDTKLGPEEITRDIPNVGEDALKDLDDRGIIRIGAEVRPNDILVGKVTPKGETELTAEERLLRAIFGEKAREVRDTSLRVPHGETGIIVDVKVFTRENGDDVGPGVNQLVRVYIAQKRKISVGDKMAGRHGNKGVVSRVLPVEDMPFLPNGRPLDIVLNPLGIPSRMNIGQVLETHLSLAAKALGWKISTPVFDGANEIDIMDTLEMANDYVNTSWEEFSEKWKPLLNGDIYDELYANRDHREEWKGVALGRDGKVQLRDGRSGEPFDNRVTIGFMHYLKLHHLVDEKIHARSTGPYSLVTQQPLGGKAQFGGQRFGEMEVWALEAYGAAYTLQEILTVKSDDIVGRVKTYEAIVKGENIPEPGVPESFKVLLKELQSLALDIRVLREDQTEVEIKECIEDVDDLNVNIDGYEEDEYRQPRSMTAEEELMREFLFDDETGVEADNSDLLSDDYSGDSADDFDYEDEE